MPSFSLPGTSIGTEEAEWYLSAREHGAGRSRAGKQLVDQGLSWGYPKQLDRMLSVAVSRAKALLNAQSHELLSGLRWIRAVTESTQRPLWSLNRFCLSHRCNCICFCRVSILSYPPRSAGKGHSHNRGSPAD
jgi:hypothetical protein